MNFFFGIKSSIIESCLTIPKFQNFGKSNKELKIFEAFPQNNKWKINQVNCEENENFFLINNQIENNNFFFFS